MVATEVGTTGVLVASTQASARTLGEAGQTASSGKVGIDTSDEVTDDHGLEDMADPHPEYVLSSSEAESERLEKQAALYGGMAFLETAIARGPRRVLEVGCGTGHFSRQVAARLPNAEVIGLDLDPGRIAYARAQAHAPNLEYLEGDLGALQFDEARFDLVFSRFVMVHYPEPTAALREQARVLRSGGMLLALDMIHDGVWFSPRKPTFQEFLSRAISAMRARGLEPDQGLHLPLALERAGLIDVQHRVLPHSIRSADPIFAAYRQNWLDTIVAMREGLADDVGPDVAEAARRELLCEEDALLVEITAQAHGQKP